MIFRLLVIAFLLRPISNINAQDGLAPTRIVDLPQGEKYELQSPNRRWILIFESPAGSSERRLWIEDCQSHTRRLVQPVNRAARLSWSPDSRLFFLVDEWGSNGSDSYLIEPSSLKRTNLADLIAKRYPALFTEYRKAGHVYFEARRWLTPDILILAMTGHFDEPPARGFTYLFHIGRDGGVRKVAESAKEEHR